jgi:hypothetical protein
MIKTLKIILFIKIHSEFNRLIKKNENFNIVKYKLLNDYYFYKKRNPMYKVCSAKTFIKIMFSQVYDGPSLLNLFIQK